MTPEQIGDATLYLGDCLPILDSIDPASVALVLADPPYGIGIKANYKDRKRTALAVCNNFPNIVGDHQPFDPTPLLRFKRVVMFGANHYADRLPASPSWLIWDKLAGLTSKRGLGFNDQADCEMAWTNLGGPARIIPHRWMGCMKGSEHGQRRMHPTQKPQVLMRSIIEHYTHPGDLILDPYMGSGTTVLSAIQTGRRAIGIEIEPTYYAIARARLSAPRQTTLAEVS